MKGLTKTLALGVGALTLSMTLAGCITVVDDKPAPDKSSASQKTDKKDAPDKSGGEAKADGSELAPGESTDGAGIIEFVNYDDESAMFSHQVTDISLAPQSDVDAIVEEISQVAGMDVYYITVSSNYVSGANLEHNSFSTDFDPVDADGKKLQYLSLIGWDNCESNSIPRPGDDPSAVIENCVAAVVVPGQPEPAGVAWAAYDSPYADEPALLFLG